MHPSRYQRNIHALQIDTPIISTSFKSLPSASAPHDESDSQLRIAAQAPLYHLRFTTHILFKDPPPLSPNPITLNQPRPLSHKGEEEKNKNKLIATTAGIRDAHLAKHQATEDYLSLDASSKLLHYNPRDLVLLAQEVRQ